MADYMAWKADQSRYFGSFDLSVEKLQKPWPAEAGYELVETSYFGFCIPEEGINGEIYHWIHPKLGAASGGLIIFQGKKSSQTFADYMDYREFQPIPEDITDCTYTTGIKIKMVKPAEEWEISFDDPAEKVSLRLHAKAIMPRAFRPTGGHMAQALKNSGTLVLRGKEYKINSYFTRDRSWGDPRNEKRMDIPPPGWHMGVFSDDFAFHAFAFDSPELNPAQAKRYPGFENGKNLMWGYLWKDGKLLGVKSCLHLTTREADGISPSGVKLTLIDEHDVAYDIDGTIVSRMPAHIWPNFTGMLCLTRWTYRDQVGYGETQEGVYENWARENYRGK